MYNDVRAINDLVQRESAFLDAILPFVEKEKREEVPLRGVVLR